MLNALKHRILTESHRPGLIGAVFNPFYLARRALWHAVGAAAPELHGQLLDVGCGSKPYRDFFTVDRYVGLDIDTPRTREQGAADHFYDGSSFPFDNESFDSVLCNQVLEHVFQPDDFMREMHRVLRPQGRVLLTVPFIWDEHEQPHDFARYSSFGLRALFERNGFRILRQSKLLCDASLFCQLMNAYVFKTLCTRNSLINAIITVFVSAPLTMLGLLLPHILPRNEDLFLDQVVLAEKIT